MIYALRCLYFSVIATTVLLLGSCDNGREEITNSQPTIDRVIVPQEVKAGQKVKLEVVAHDADGDGLTYNWEVSEGTVDVVGVWTVPSEATSATVLVHVSDGVNSSVASSKISVEIVAPPDPSKPMVPKGMVSIPTGEFQMGSNDPKAQNHEQPVHTVYVDAFLMDEHEVTNLEYQTFVLANPQWQREQIDSEFHDGEYLKLWRGRRGNDYPKGKADHPVVYVSWYTAMAYAEWVGKRPPTEAEWEYAARGGLAGKKYPWGDDAINRDWGDYVDPSRANYDRRVGDTTAVGKYPPNGYGLYDMAGNVWEWCLDEYNKDFYSMSPRENPLSGADSVDWIINNFTSVQTHRVVRGGSWSSRQVLRELSPLRVTFRRPNKPLFTNDHFGFRCARSQ